MRSKRAFAWVFRVREEERACWSSWEGRKEEEERAREKRQERRREKGRSKI